MYAKLLATWFGCGYAPIAPGTVASLAALAVAWLLVEGASAKPYMMLLPVLLLLRTSIRCAGILATLDGRKDPPIVVIDEVLGQWITLAGMTHWNWKAGVGGFFLFRLLDIWKPPPIRRLEQIPGGAGIVADDLLAGVYGGLVLFTAGCFNLY